MVFFSARRENLVLLSSRNKNQKGHKVITMDASKCHLAENKDEDIIKSGLFSPKSSKGFCIVFKICSTTIPLWQWFFHVKVWFFLSHDGLSRILLPIICAHTALNDRALLSTPGGWVPPVPTQNHREIFILYSDVRGFEKGKQEQSEKITVSISERERRGLYYMVSVHQKVHFPQLMTCPGAQPLWVVTRWYTNPTCVDCDYLLVTERGEAEGTRRLHLVICGKGMWRLTVLSISPWVWNFFKQKMQHKMKN